MVPGFLFLFVPVVPLNPVDPADPANLGPLGPHLNRLVAEGVRFDAAYSNCPVCAPARGALMTGRYISNCKIYDNAAAWPEDEITIPHYLTLAGYDTVLSGKMHFVGADQLHGFRQRLVSNIYPADFKWTMPRQDPFNMAEGEKPEPRATGGQARQYVGDAIRVGQWRDTLSYDEEAHFRALEYLHAKGGQKRQARGDDYQPFFLCVSYHHPHEPFSPPQKYWDMYEGEPIDVPERRDNLEATYSIQDKWLNDYHGCGDHDLTDPESAARVRRAYYGLVTYVDDKVSELMASLEENGLADNTVIIFTSDHGDMLCEKAMVQKRCFYEWSARIPLIMHFPDKWKAGTKTDAPVSLVDLMPTILDMANVDDRLPCDGKSLMGLLDGTDTEERVAFSEIHSEGIHGNCFMVRKGKHKYIYIHGHEDQLFDLEADPGEWNNLAANSDYGELRAELRKLILDQFDPDAIHRDLEAGLKRRRLVRKAMNITETKWDVSPQFNGQKSTLAQYLP